MLSRVWLGGAFVLLLQRDSQSRLCPKKAATKMGEEQHLLCPLHKLPGSNEVTGDMFTSTAGAPSFTLHGTCCDLMQLSSLGELNRFCTLLRVRDSGTNKPPESLRTVCSG